MIDVLATREFEKNGEKKTAWCKVGVFWPSKDPNAENGEGTIQLDALPLNGKLILKVAKPRDNSGI